MARPVDIGYEMPERYGGKEVAWKEEGVIPLAGNNNTWVPPTVQERRVCGVVRWAFWAVFSCICFLIIGGAIRGVIAGVSSSKKSSSSDSASGSAISGLAATTSYSTSVSSSTSTSTLSNGDVILITSVYTAIQTIKPQTTTSLQATSTTKISTTSSASTSANAATSSQNATSVTTTFSPGSVTSMSTAAAASKSTQSSSTDIYPLDCPAINGNTVSTTAGTESSSYTISCNTDYTSPSISTVTATSILECFNACAQYTNLQTTTCRAATFNAKLATGNCFLRSDVTSSFSTGSDNSVAVAVLVQGGVSKGRKRWFHGVVSAE
ncbi:uncharacterized protein LY89DRAFT_727412 [Mollisia scopiformis]|uniref:Apple domain-containing protein n=1 Tax=Mollisia scopiformis TaxID=149040 RepID=A0A194XX66_MOLSC|nr:uncharacterized protein LY89DRAFT_727412 [Mollisia scopiformis]KUJ24382.1 hypothetical protein LY89DRAFT_727412 [Mollisia scopiformis]